MRRANKNSATPNGLSRWLAAAAKRTPDNLALEVPGAVNLTYRDLALAVAEQSAALLAAGLKGGDRVGIAASRSADTIVAILAAIDAGIGYVPLDLAYPAERLVAMLEDAQPRAVLGEPQALAQLETLVGDLPSLSNPAPVQPAPHAAENDLTYVLFTSGSTGRPKGVAMGSRPLRSLIEWHASHPRLGQPARTLLFAPLSFDVHFQEIFSTLACGGTLILIPEEQRRDPGLLLKALIEHRIERVFVPYVALQMIADAARDNTPATLRDVISAGEQLQVTPAIRSLFMRLPGAELHNHYGPTESHVVTAHELRGDPSSWPEIPPIGLPLPHVRIVLHNRSEESADGNDTGELLLGGDTLADGYLGRPDLTAERFRSDIDGLSGRWYVTGDLVRLDPKGVCTYLGRADQQLKVDGFRIEPGEIELAMMAHDGVKDAVVTAPDLPGIGKQLVAYLVLRDPEGTDPAQLISELRAHLRGSMPEYMVPVRFLTLDKLPTTPSGKIDRRGLPLPSVESKVSAAGNPLEVTRTLWQELLGLPRIDDNQNLFDLGARSLLVMRFAARLKDLGIQGVSVADIYDRPTVAGIADAMGKSTPNRKKVRSTQAVQATAGIAIVGMATRTPGAANVDAFWQNLLDGKEGIRHFALGEIDPSIPDSIRSRPNFVPAHGVLEDVERFDAAYFGISAREATMLDPQQRLMLELSVSALEHAAIDPSRTDARIGVYAGTGNNAYAPALRQEQPELVHQYGEFATMLASEKDYVATRVAHRLNLNGPAVSIHTACSTSLVAVSQAWHALSSGQCDIALAGGTNVVVPQINGYLHVEGGMESADGHCRPFDAEASGTVFASGGGVVVLRRLEDALASGDTIYGIIRGVGINNDGGDKASFTAPSVSGQASAIRMALDYARVDARQIGYVEAHGTGTSLGDPIEVAAITRAWREDTADNQFCGIGSVKGNLGHMAAGAGVIGLIKATLSLHHGIIPGTLHYRRPNPQIDFANTPFKVVAQNTPWPRAEQARLAAVSSFGVGGTNAHVIIEEASPPPQHPQANQESRIWVLPLSARTQDAALRRARDLADHLARHPELPLADVAATLMRGRKPMAQRLSVVASSVQEAVDALRAARSSVAALQKPRIVFLFPGQGSQHPGMARRLYDEAPAFREALDRSLDIANLALGVDLRQWLVTAEPGDTALAQTLAETRYAQPALFSVSYALAAWLDSLGLRPDAMIGHSIGEYAAACHAGVFSVEDAMTAVIARGQAMFDQPRGAMLAVRTDAEKVRALHPAGIEIAGCNAPALTVVAGSVEAIDSFAKQLEAQEVDSTRLRVSHAFHSASMDGALPLVEKSLARAKLRPPEATVYSCVSGAPLQADEATDPHYWAKQVRAPVMFSRAVGAELARGDTVFVEVGPGQALTALLRQHRTPEGSVPRNIPILGPAQDPGDPARQAISALGSLWCSGVELAWPVAATAQRIPLPTYPFEGQRHWFTRRALAGTTVTQAQSFNPELPASTPPAESIAIMSRIPTIENELKRVLSDVSGLSADEMLAETSFVDLGLDSLSLTQSTLELERVFGIKLRFRRLMEDLDTIAKLAQFLDAEMPADKFRPAAPPPTPVAVPAMAVMPAVAPAALMPSYAAPQMQPSAPTLPPGDQTAVHVLIQQQVQLMAQQLALLSGQPAAAMPATQPQFAPATVAIPAAPVAPTSAASPSASDPAQPSIKSLIEKPFGASPRLTLDAKQDFTPAQRQWLDEFIGRYNARSGKSKTFSQQHRKVMADPRVATGFNPLWKDLVYPIVVDRSKGANLWDLDGNEYIDLLSCFGGNLLGYQPQDVIDAMAHQLKLGLEVGPQHPIAAEVATLISEFTGMERVAFCNTGSEAVMGAMRIARTVTGRKTIAIFTNSYHGIFDEVIVRGTKQLRSLSAAPGILANAVENILVLDWNSEDSLRVLRERGPELAAIMTEPIQNKYPTIQPREFVQSLRQIADQAGCALIFDEVVTGFRVAPGGSQEFYGVRADIATYGKVIGGGLPFAAIAGNSKWLDALDGGHWQYGDDSYPEAGVTYFAGTFVRHPLALSAARAALLHIKKGGRELYRTLNGRTQALADRLNSAFAARGAPVKAVHCASLWRLQWDDNLKYVSLFYYLARFHGLHLYEQFGHFVTEAMGDAEIDRIVQVFTNSLDELMALGFINPRDGGQIPPDVPGGGEKKTASRTESCLSPGQTERWLAGAFDSHARRALNESFCVGLKGNIDRTALLTALQDVLMRHGAFRVKFDLDEPKQLLTPSGPIPVAEIDLSGQADADKALDDFCTEASLRDFPLDQAPLAAVSLLSLADGRLVVHVVASHLVFDGWASSVFNAELAKAYKARSIGCVPDLEPAASPLDFAEEESARFTGTDGQEALRFWQKQLAKPPAPLALGDLVPPKPRTYAADTLRVKLDGDLFVRLRTTARQSGATLFQTLLTAVSLMLNKRSGQTDFVVSIPYASQSLQRRGPVMADGVLDLPLRLQCRPGEDGTTVLRRVRTQLMDALEYPLMTQGTVARTLGIVSSGDRPPLTGIYFNLNPKVDLSAYAPLSATMHEGRKRGTLSELFFNFYEQEDALTLDLHYSSEFFSPTRARELIDALMAECAAFAGLPAREPAKAPAVPEYDPRLAKWNSTAVPLEPHARIEQWVSRQAAATPDAIALIARGKPQTFAAVESRANRFGSLLRTHGVEAGMLVGVCLTRGPDLIPALLGILKTGAAYVPLDPGFPKDRLHYMAEDAEVRMVITDSVNAALSGVPREKQIRIDDDSADIAAASDAPLPVQADWGEDAPAYVIYTSGSTGKPKGVVVPQNAVCNFLASMRREPGLTSTDRLLAVTTLSFDIAVLELFLPLTTGARFVLAQREDAMDAEAIIRMIGEYDINVMQATPTTWHMLLDENWTPPKGFRALCGGEPLPPSLAANLLDKGVELWNMYGPTETTVWSTLCRIGNASQKITVGRPIDNTQVWILDEHLKSCPVGQEGELCIGGAGVANGYFKRESLTAEKFIPDPFANTPGARIYRTGDLARWREDGTLEHLGRLDFQVKIRGYRIELGEIEARLANLPDVARTVVVAREDSPGDVRLVGYVVARPGTQPDASRMRDALRNDLPDYMVPQSIVLLESMPLLPNGKIDRKALPATSAPQEPQVPATATGSHGIVAAGLTGQIGELMGKVLGCGPVQPDQNFFELGGHSLLAAKLATALKDLVGHRPGLRVIFESPTPARLATALGGGQADRDKQPVRAPITHRADQSAAPLTAMQERIRFVEEMHPDRVAYNAPSGHRLRGRMDLDAFRRAFNDLIRRQPSLRTSIESTDTGYVQRVHEMDESYVLPLIDLTGEPSAQRDAHLDAMLSAMVDETFDLSRAPLFKATLFKLAEDDHVLFFMTHHIIWDGWSFDVLYAEISALYEAHRTGVEPSLPPLDVTYGDFAQWHCEWLKSQELRDQIDYWKKQFSPQTRLSHPAGDFPRTASFEHAGGTARMDVDKAQIDGLRALAKRCGTTTSIVILSVYGAMTAQWLREAMPSIGLPVRGRGTPELDAVMGFFNNMLPVRFRPDSSASLLDWIKSVHQTMVTAYASQEAPFELLAAELESAQGGAAPVLYQAMFSYQDARARQTQWGNLAHERIPLPHRGTTEDLNIWMVELADSIEAGLQYNADLFLPETADRLRSRLLALLESVIANPEQSLAQLLAVGDDDIREVRQWTTDTRNPPSAGDFIDRIDDLARSAPGQVAIRIGKSAVTRGELAKRVESVTRRLQNLDIPAGSDVLLAIDDVVEHTAAALAAWRLGFAVAAGTSTVKVAAVEPRFVLCDSPISLAQEGNALWIPVTGDSHAEPVHAMAGASLCAIGRKNFAEIIETLAAKVKPLPGDRTLCFIDDAPSQRMFTIVMSLAASAEAYVAPQGLPANPAQFADTLLGENISWMHASGTAWRSAVAGLGNRSLELVAVVDVTDMNADLAGVLLGRGCTLLSQYRPHGFVLPFAASLIGNERDCAVFGRPLIAGAMDVRDDAGAPLPITVAGTLRVTLAGAAQDTGSLARWRADGVLQYLGEAGTVAYVEGRRIDTARLRTAIESLPGVVATAIATRDDPVLHRCMTIGIEAAAGSGDDAHWERTLAPLLGGLTSFRLHIASLPRFADGSVDSNALLTRRRNRTDNAAPLTSTQSTLVEVWQDVLGLTDVGLQDNFFELGGTSLAAMQVSQRLESRLSGRRISPRRYVFETLEQLAAAYDDISADTSLPADTPGQAELETESGGLLTRIKRLVGRK